jgi:broad specificity phosphatase PhoE
MSDRTRIWLVRHGEIGSYLGDQGLTDCGQTQAREAGAKLTAELGDASVALLHAPSVRARETAEVLGASMRDRGVDLDDPAPHPGFRNFAALIDGQVSPHDDIRVAITSARARPEWRPAHPRDWEHDADRFATIHDGGGDPITWWLTQPTLSYEPPSLVVRRFWRAMAALARRRVSHVVVCTHSGPIRAVAAHAVQHDPGEPLHLEWVAARLSGGRAGDPAQVTYRGVTVALSIPTLEEPTWD